MSKLPSTKSSDTSLIVSTEVNSLHTQISEYIDQARKTVQRAIDQEMLKAYWKIGKIIVVAEQKGTSRAKYGENLIKELSDKLVNTHGKGFSETNIKYMRQFYIEYSVPTLLNQEEKSIRQTVSDESEIPEFSPNLGWSHYCILMRLKRSDARSFYEIEASRNNWSVRELRRQTSSLLFDRLAKSKDKKGILELAYQGQELNFPKDAIKDPLILEFLSIPEVHQFVENKLEEALITNLQKFLLELGRGFAFIARQKRITLENNDYYVDLVFYHVILKCYFIIEIKTTSLSHSDLGQIQFYVNYFDEEVKSEGDNPTVGLVLCTEKCDTMVRYTLADKAKQIFASTYQFHLPTISELEKELMREIKEVQHIIKENDGNL